MEVETLTDVQENELKAGVAEIVNSVGEWMRFLLNSARAASCKARVIKFRPIVSSACNFSDENSFRFCDGITDPVFFSTLAEFSWMISSDKIELPQTHEEEWNACCIALGSYLALEIRTSTIYPISGKINAQPLDVVLIAGGKCSSAGRLELQVDGKFDRFVYRSLGSLDVCSIVLLPDVMMRNCLPRLGIDVVQVILQFVGSPFTQVPFISIKTSDDIVLCHNDEGPSISYNRDIFGAQILSVSSCLSPQSRYSRFRDYVKYECSWYGNGRTAKVKKTHLRRTNDCYYDGNYEDNYEDNYDGHYDGHYEEDYDGYYDGYNGLDEG